eukprot:GHVU01109061.1.p1 GENE.GHVU01109061.1~~GHVU01109061.1.p1  ORF type:complete len:134 (+),score=7.92 GHVU01109061.1:173-574(+)
MYGQQSCYHRSDSDHVCARRHTEDIHTPCQPRHASAHSAAATSAGQGRAAESGERPCTCIHIRVPAAAGSAAHHTPLDDRGIYTSSYIVVSSLNGLNGYTLVCANNDSRRPPTTNTGYQTVTMNDGLALRSWW